MNEKEIFQVAVELSDLTQRQAYLASACGGNDALRARVEALLAAYAAAASDFLNVPVMEQTPSTFTGQQRTLDLPAAAGRMDAAARNDHNDDETDSAADLSFLQPPTKPGSLGRLGHYEILQVLGQGAFGIVFKAFDEKLHRQVAIKAMSPQLALTSPPRKRFLREARSVAALKHENIVQIYSVEEQPIPYLAMEFVDGQTLAQKLDNSGWLEVPEILHLGRQMAAGLAAAHDKGLIHRDIKPGNILLEAGAEQKVKITDFGLARAADDATMTRTGTIAGTPMYMAPEQAMGQTLDHRADLFSLGSVLYQMTCGRPPFRGANAMAVLKRVIDETPRPIQDILPQVPDWLCAIIEKLQAKNPDERYQTAKEVADVLVRCQNELQVNGQVTMVPVRLKTPAVVAPPAVPADTRFPAQPPAANVACRWPLVAVLTAAILLIVGLGVTQLTGFTHLFRKSSHESLPFADRSSRSEQSSARLTSAPDRRAAEWLVLAGGRVRVNDQQRDITNVDDLPSEDFVLTEIGFNSSRTEQMTDQGWALFERCTGLKALHLSNPAVTDSQLAFFRNCKNLIDLRLPSTGVTDAGLANFKGCRQLKNLDLRFTSVTDAGMLNFNDCKNLVELSLSETKVSDVGLACFQGCNQITSLLLEGTQVTDAGLVHFNNCKNLCKLHLHRTQVTDQGLAHLRNCPSLDFIDVGGTQVTGKGFSHFKHCKFADLSNTFITDEGLTELAVLPRLVRVNLRNSRVTPAGIEAFKQSRADCVIDWDGVVFESKSTSSMAPKTVLRAPSAVLEALRGDQISRAALAMAGDGDPTKAPGCLVGVLGEVRPIQNDRINGLAFSPDGRWLASASHDKTILLRDAKTGQVSRVLQGHSGPVTSVAFSQDGKTLVSASHDSTLKLWSVEAVSETQTLQETLGPIHTLAASPDGRFLAAGGTTGVIKLWKWGQWNTPTELKTLPGKIHALSFSTNGELLGSGEGQGTDSRVRLYQTSDGTVKLTWEAGSSPINALAFHRDGRWLATSGGSNFVRLWEVTSGQLVAERETWTQWGPLAFHPDGKSLYAYFPYETGLLLELPALNHTGEQGRNTFLEPPVASVSYSPDGMNLAFGTPHGDVVIWDNGTGTKRLPEGGHSHYITGLAVSPDGRTVLSSGDENVLRRWDVSRPANSQLVQRFDCGLLDAVWSPDGKKFATIAAVTWYEMAQRGVIWDAATGQQRVKLDPLHQIYNGAFSPDGKWFAACSYRDECIHLWDAMTGKQVHQFPQVGICLDRPAFSADGELLAVATRETKTVKIWNVANGDEVYSWEDLPMRSVALRPDGRMVAAGHFDGSISLWDLSRKDRGKRTLGGHSLPVNTLRFTPDGKTLVSSSDDGTIRVWNTWAVRALREIISVGRTKKPLRFDLDPSGQYLFAGGNSPLIYVMRIPSPEDLPPVDAAVAPDRRAAEWVLSVGGKVRVNNNSTDDIVDRTQLPSDRFRLTYVQLSGNAQVRDDDLAIFASCQDLEAIGLDDTHIGNGGVRPFANSKRLTHLYVQGTRIDDAGLAAFDGCQDLLAIGLGGTGVSKDSIKTIRGFSKLQFLDVTKTKMTENEIKQLRVALPSCKIVYDGGVIAPTTNNHALPGVQPSEDSDKTKGD